MTDKTLLSYTRRAIFDYEMIRPHDRIAVGISGGKDSLTLLSALALYRRFSPAPFELCAIHIDLGFSDEPELAQTRALCERLGVELWIEKTQIGRVIFDERREKNPCSLCSKMRRGALARAAAAKNCNVIALGHNRDDAVETLILNLFYAGRIATFEPVSFLDRSRLRLIRPLVYIEEREITYYCTRHSIIPDKSPCPANKHTRREEIKQLLLSLSKQNPDLKSKLFGAIRRANLDGFHAIDRYRERQSTRNEEPK